MATKPRKRTPLLIILVGVLLGFIGTTLLFGGASQATTPSVGVCEGKGCVECDSSTQKCLPPPAPTPEPPAPSVTPEPPASTPDLTPTPSPEPGPVASVLAKTGISASSLPWVAVILAAAGWELCNKAQQKRRAWGNPSRGVLAQPASTPRHTSDIKVHTRSTTERTFSLSKINMYLILLRYYCKITECQNRITHI